MQKHQGNVIFTARDEDGLIEVVDEPGERSLHFGTLPRQSTMSLFDPVYLQLTYTRVMMSCLLFHHTPARVLLIGLGGGSLAKFILHHFPRCKLDIVETRSLVAEVAHEYFALPHDSRMTMHFTDGASFISDAAQQPSLHGKYDIILVDAYRAEGMDLSINQNPFFDGCRQLLSQDGVVTINLWGSEPLVMRETLDLMHAAMDGPVFQVGVRGRANIIGHALASTASDRTPMPRKQFKQLADDLEKKTGLECRQFLRDLHLDRTPKMSNLFGLL